MVEPEIRGGGEHDVTDEPNNTLENVLFRPEGDGLRINAIVDGEDATIRNCGIEGVCSDEYNHIIYPQARGENDTITIQNFHMSDGVRRVTSEGKGNLIFVYKPHAGLLKIQDSWFETTRENPGEDTIYGSPPGHFTDAKTSNPQGGAIQIERCFSRNYGAPGEESWGWRFASGERQETYLKDTVMDGREHCVPVGALYGQNMGIYNCDIAATDGLALRIGEPAPKNPRQAYEVAELTVENSRIEGDIERNLFTDAEIPGRLNGSFDSNPDLTPPPTCPRSAMEAASTEGEPDPVQSGPKKPKGVTAGDMAIGLALAYAYRKRQE